MGKKWKAKSPRLKKALVSGNGWRGSVWVEGPGYSARRGEMGSDATGEENCGRSRGLESWNRGTVESGKALESRGKTLGGYEEKNQKIKITFRQTKVPLSDRQFQTDNSYRTGAKNISAPSAGPGEAL